MRTLALLILLVSVSGCETVGRWTKDSMAWADRTMPTYDDWFGDEKPAQAQVDYTQRTPAPVTPVQAVDTTPPPPLSSQQEMYYDNSERGHSFPGQAQ